MMHRASRFVPLAVGLVLLALLFGFRVQIVAVGLQAFLARGDEHPGLRFSVGAIKGSYLSSLEIQDFSAIAEDEAAGLRALNCKRAVFHYSLPALWTGLDSFLAGMTVELDGLHLDIRADPPAGEPSSRLHVDAVRSLPLPGILPRVRAGDTTVRVVAGQYETTLEGLSLLIGPPASGQGRQPIQLTVGQASLVDRENVKKWSDLAVLIHYSARDICVESLLVDGFQYIESACFDLADIDKGRLSWELDLNIFDGRLVAAGRMDGRYLDLKLSGRELDLDQIDSSAGFRQQVTGRLSIQSDIRFNIDIPVDMTGTMRLQVRDGRVGDLVVDRVELEAAAAEQRFSLQRLIARAGNEAIEIVSTSLPLAAILSGNLREALAQGNGLFAVHVEDLSSLLTAANIRSPLPEDSPPVSLSGRGEIRDGTIELEEFQVIFDENAVTVADAAVPAAALLLWDPFRLLSEVRGDCTLHSANMPALVRLAYGRTAGLPLKVPAHLLDLAGRLDKGRITLSPGRLHAASADIELARGLFILPAAGESVGKTSVDAALKVEIRDLNSLAAIFALPELGGALTGHLDISGPLESPAGTMDIAATNLARPGLELGNLQMRATAAAGLLTVEMMELRNGADRLHGTAVISLAEQQIRNLDLDLWANEASVYLESLLPGDLKIRGKMEASLSASGPLSAPETVWNVTLDDGGLNGIEVNQARVSMHGTGRKLRVNSADFALADGGLSGTGSLDWEPGWRRFAVRLDSLVLHRKEAGLELAHPASFTYEAGKRLQVEKLLLTGRSGTVEADGLWLWSGESNLRIRTTDLAGKDWFDLLVADRVFFDGASIELNLSGDRAEPRITATGTVAGLAGLNAPFAFNGDIDLASTKYGIDIRRFDWRAAAEQGFVRVRGQIPLNPLADKPFLEEEFSLEASFELPELAAVASLLPEKSISGGSLQGALVLRGRWQNPVGSLQLTGSRLSLPGVSALGAPGLFDLHCQLTALEDRISVKAFRLASPEMSVDVSGQWFAPLFAAGILRGERPDYTDTMLDLNGRLAVSDVSWAATGMTSVRRLAGRLELNAAVTGTPGKPEVNGLARLSEGELRTSYGMPTIRAINMEARIDPREVRITSLQGELGGALFSLSGTVREYLFGSPQVDLVFSGSNLLLYRDAGMKFRGDTALEIHGPLDRLAISGDVVVTDGHYVRNVDWFSSFRGTGQPESRINLQGITFIEPPLNKASLQIRVESAQGVRIKNNMIDGAVRPALVLSGTGENPYLVGTVYLEPTKIKMPAGRITVQSGLINFPEEDPERPLVDLTGESRIMGYDISVQAEGSIYEPIITLSSSPPLPDDELLLLLLTGKTPKTAEGPVAGQRGGSRVAMYIGRNLLTKWFGSGFAESDESVLDRFDLEIGRGLSRLGEETIDARFRLTDKLFTEDDILFITAEKDIYDAFNSGIKLVFRFQ